MDAEIKIGKVFLYLIVIVASEFAIIALISGFYGNNYIKDIERIDRELAIQYMSFDGALDAERAAQRTYKHLIVDNNIDKTIKDFILPSDNEKNSSTGLEGLGKYDIFPAAETAIESVFLILRRFLVRIQVIASISPVMLLTFALPAVIDGMMQWRRRQYSFDYPSPVVHGTAATIVKWTIITLFAYALAPLPFHPLAPLLGAMVLGLSASLWAAHTMKRI